MPPKSSGTSLAIESLGPAAFRLIGDTAGSVPVDAATFGLSKLLGGTGTATETLDPLASADAGIKALTAPNNMAGATGEEVDAYVSGLPRTLTPTSKASGLFEVEQTGPYNYTVPARDDTIDIDGYRGTTIQDAKFVEKPDVSPYINGSNVPDFLRRFALEDQQWEFERFARVINDRAVPSISPEVLTNDSRAVPYFQNLIIRCEIPDTVTVVSTRISQILPKAQE